MHGWPDSYVGMFDLLKETVLLKGEGFHLGVFWLCFLLFDRVTLLMTRFGDMDGVSATESW